jgi:hypothetical protein
MIMEFVGGPLCGQLREMQVYTREFYFPLYTRLRAFDELDMTRPETRTGVYVLSDGDMIWQGEREHG